MPPTDTGKALAGALLLQVVVDQQVSVLEFSEPYGRAYHHEQSIRLKSLLPVAEAPAFLQLRKPQGVKAGTR